MLTFQARLPQKTDIPWPFPKGESTPSRGMRFARQRHMTKRMTKRSTKQSAAKIGFLLSAVLALSVGCSKDALTSGQKACSYGGKSYKAGASFPSTDGCNTCSCDISGSVACTLMACLGDAGFSPPPPDDAAKADWHPGQSTCSFRARMSERATTLRLTPSPPPTRPLMHGLPPMRPAMAHHRAMPRMTNLGLTPVTPPRTRPRPASGRIPRCRPVARSSMAATPASA